MGCLPYLGSPLHPCKLLTLLLTLLFDLLDQKAQDVEQLVQQLKPAAKALLVQGLRKTSRLMSLSENLGYRFLCVMSPTKLYTFFHFNDNFLIFSKCHTPKIFTAVTDTLNCAGFFSPLPGKKNI